MLRTKTYLLVGGLFFTQPQAALAVQKANTACSWSLLKAVQVFESLCSPGEISDYRSALDDSVSILEKATRELGTVSGFSAVVETSEKQIGEFIAKDPALCRRGSLFEMAHHLRAKDPDWIRSEALWIASVPRENQVPGCL